MTTSECLRALLDAAGPGDWPDLAASAVNALPRLLAVVEAAERVDGLGTFRTIDPGMIRERAAARCALRAALAALEAEP